MIGRTFYEDCEFGYDGEIEFEGGEFVVDSIDTGGWVMCKRKDTPSESIIRRWNQVKERVLEFESEIVW